MGSVALVSLVWLSAEGFSELLIHPLVLQRKSRYSQSVFVVVTHKLKELLKDVTLRVSSRPTDCQQTE